MKKKDIAIKYLSEYLPRRSSESNLRLVDASLSVFEQWLVNPSVELFKAISIYRGNNDELLQIAIDRFYNKDTRSCTVQESPYVCYYKKRVKLVDKYAKLIANAED